MLVSGGGKEGGGLLAAKVIQLFRISIRWSVESENYASCSTWR